MTPSINASELAPVDRQFARVLLESAIHPSQELELAALLVSARRAHGDSCVLLANYAGRRCCDFEEFPSEESRFPELDRWIQLLQESGVVGAPGEFKPLILTPTGRLYLHRYWQYERIIAGQLVARAALLTGYDPAILQNALTRFFPDHPGAFDWQALAALTAVTRGVTVLSGGPGTGKTRTIVWILGLLLELNPDHPPRVALVAPTGKAASRIAESLRNAIPSLPVPDSRKALLSTTASTLHRFLGIRPGGGTGAERSRSLACDVVIVDEASLVDASLMARLLMALPDNARLILVGDKDQLASVETGSVLGEIWNTPGPHGYSTAWADTVEPLLGRRLPQEKLAHHASVLADGMVELQQTRRFTAESGIRILSEAVRRGDPKSAISILNEERPDLAWNGMPAESELADQLYRKIQPWVSRLLAASDPASALALLGQFRILTALRQGRTGVVALNATIERELRRHRLVHGTGEWYRGRPILVTRNDPGLRLSNGDVGIAWDNPETPGKLAVFFHDAEHGLQAFSPTRLPPHESVYSMTIHKAQGSEFDRVLMVLSDAPNALLTREMIYTGITRARAFVDLWASDSTVRLGIGRRSQRTSGLGEDLWGAFPTAK
jgi:exodeoxyribonuclease V alpha subunit